MNLTFKLTIGLIISAGAAFGMTLVNDGVSCFEIVTGKTSAEVHAVEDLSRIVEAVTGAGPVTNGATVKIVVGTPETNHAIAEAAKKFGIKLEPAANDTFAVKADKGGSAVYCAGNTPRAAMFAVYELLETLGCRWFWPGQDGEFLPPETKTLSIPDSLDICSTAAFKYRQLSSHPNKDKSAFFAHNKLNPWGDPHGYGFTQAWGGHSFNWIFPEDCKKIEEYFEKYPEQFALNDGVRSIKQHCYTNPDTIRTFVEWIDRFWDRNPDVDILNLSARDAPVYCHCPECSKVDSSTLFFQFINKIVEGAEKKHPGKKYGTIAYSFYVNPPKVKLNPNVTMSYCMYNRCYKHLFGDSSCPVNSRAIDAMAAWKDVLGHAPAIYGYHFDVFSGKPHYAALGPVFAEEVKWARDFGVEYWHTEYHAGGPGKGEKRTDSRMLVERFPAYVVTRLLWNPDLDYDAVLKDYCEHVYGAAAPLLFDYHKQIDKIWQGSGHASYYNNNPAGFADSMVTSAVTEQFDALFEKALAAVADNERATKEVTFEKDVWERWRDLKLSRDNWAQIAAKPDEERLEFLAKVEPGEIHFDAFATGKKAKNKFADTCVITNNGETTFASYSPGNARKNHDGLLFGNHPKFTNGPCKWVNYELSYQFRLPDGKTKNGFWTFLRSGAERFGNDKFERIDVHVDLKKVSVSKFIKHGEPSVPLGEAKLDAPLTNAWHDISLRVIDTKMIVKLDGRELLVCDVPVGAGAFNIRSYSPLDIAGLKVRDIPSPSVADLWNVEVPLSATAPNMDGTGTDTAWNAGKTVKSFFNRGTYKPESEATLLRTDKALYLRFIGYGDMEKAKAKCFETDGNVYSDDGVELYLDPNNTRTDYYWIVVNTANVRCDAEASVGMNIRKGWNGKWTSKTSMHEDHWVIEFEFPYSTFGEPAEGIPWLLGLNRCGNSIRQSWTDATYHSPNSFRTLHMSSP